MSNATGTLTTAQMTEILTTEKRSEANAKALLLNEGLIVSETAEATATNVVSAAKLEELVRTEKLTVEEAELLASKAGVTLANYKEASSFSALSTSVKNVGNSLLALVKAHPILAVVTVAITAVTTAITIAEKKNEEYIESQKELIEKTDENISKYDDEISSLDSLQKALHDAKGDKEKLASIQGELNKTIGDTPGLLNAESEAYNVTNQKIDDRIKRLKELRKLELEDKVTAQKEIFNNSTVDNAWGIDRKFDTFSNHKMNVDRMVGYDSQPFTSYVDKDISSGATAIEVFKNLKKNSYGEDEDERKSNAEIWKELIDSFDGTTDGAWLEVEEIQKFFDNQTEYAQKILSEYINNSESIFSKEELNNVIKNLVESGYAQDLEGIENVVTSLVENDELETAINDYYESLYNNDVDSDALYKNVKQQFDVLTNNYPELKEILDNFFNNIGKDINTGANTVSVTNPISFTDTLNSADNAEIKDELLELAKSGEITPEVLSSTEEYANLLKSTDTSAESAMNQILDLLTAQEKLAGFSQGLDKLKSAYEEFKDEDIGFVTAETLESLPDAFKNLPEFDLFSQIVGDPTSGAEAIQQAFNDITKAYMLSQDVLQGLVGASEHDIQSYIANLKQMGVTNADEVVNLAVEALNSENELINGAQAEIEQAYQKHLEDKTFKYEEYLNNQAVQNVSLVNALGESYKGDYDNWCELLANKAKAYNEFITALEASGITYDSSLTARGNADKYANQGHGASAIADMYTKAATADYASYKADQLKNSIKLDLSQIKTNFGTSYSPSTGSSGSSGSKEETVNTETYDWIEKKLEAIAKKTEKAGEAFEKAFSLSSTNKKYKEYLSQINTEITANNTAIQAYQAKLNSIGLSGDWIARIQNGEYSITDVTDDALNERIGLYQEYYDKLVSCQETVEELQEKRLEVQNQYAEKVIGIYEREIEKLDRIIEKREALIELKESFVGYASKSDLKYEQKYYQKELNSLEEQNDKLIKLRKTVKKNSDAWNTYTEKINENKSSILDLTQSIADLAEKLANLPLEKLERKLDSNDTKRSLNDAKLSNATSASAKNSILNNQISLENSDNRATQTYAEETAKAVTTNIKSIKSAKNSDKKGQSKAERKKINSYYKQIQKYTKSKKSIPASLITKLANAGYSNLVQACSNYNESLDANKAAQETVKLTAEQTKANINELKKQQFDNIQEDYSRKASQIQAKASKVDSQISLLQAKGHMSSASWYNDVIKYEQQNLANSQAELKALKAKQNEMTKYTDEWWEAQDAIDSVTQSISDSTIKLQEYVNTMREIRLENFDFLQGQISRLNSEAEYFIDLMQNMELSGDNGITNYGLTAMGMYYQQIQTNLEMAEKYANMAKEIEQQLLKEPYNTDLLVDYQELVDKQREMITNNESLKKSIADLVKDGYETLLDSLGEVIDKYKEVLSSAKDAHDYQKNISDKTENINTLQKQIIAYSSMTGNEEVVSKLQSLQAEYKDAQEDLQETLYDKYISDTEEVLDEMLDELETFIEELSKNTDELYEEGVKQIASNTGSIYDTLKSLVGTSGISLSEQMKSIWDSESIAGAIKDSALSSEITTAIQNAVSSIVSAISHMEIESDKQTDITAFNEIATKYNSTDYASQLGNAMSKLNDANNALIKASNASIGLPTLDEIEQLETKRQKTQYKFETAPTAKLKKQYLQQLLDIDKQFNNLATTRDKVIQSGKELENIQQTINRLNQEVNNIRSAQIKATENNKSVIKELLNSIANPYSLTGEDQTELDEKVSKILGKTVFLSEHNIEQLAKLFGTEANPNAILFELATAGLLNITDVLKNAGFATGGIAKAVGEDGIALVRNGEGFVMPEHVPMIQGLLDSVPKIDAFINTTLPNLPSNRGGDIAQTIEIGDIYMSGVNDPQEFSKQLINSVKNDSKVQKTFGTFVNNSLTGKNSLGIRKY